MCSCLYSWFWYKQTVTKSYRSQNRHTQEHSQQNAVQSLSLARIPRTHENQERLKLLNNYPPFPLPPNNQVEDGGIEVSSTDFVKSGNLNPGELLGARRKLTRENIDGLIAFIKQDFNTWRLHLQNIRREIGWGKKVSDTTILKALKSSGISPYWKELKFIFIRKNTALQLRYYKEKKEWKVKNNGKWLRYMRFTDEMSIEIGGISGVYTMLRERGEQCHNNCIGAMKKQGNTIMCWGLIKWRTERPFFV